MGKSSSIVLGAIIDIHGILLNSVLNSKNAEWWILSRKVLTGLATES
jgi:hypothetical protein